MCESINYLSCVNLRKIVITAACVCTRVSARVCQISNASKRSARALFHWQVVESGTLVYVTLAISLNRTLRSPPGGTVRNFRSRNRPSSIQKCQDGEDWRGARGFREGFDERGSQNLTNVCDVARSRCWDWLGPEAEMLHRIVGWVSLEASTRSTREVQLARETRS